MIAGKTIVNESVFLELAKLSIEKLNEVGAELQGKNPLTSITKMFDNKESTPKRDASELITVLDIKTTVKHQMSENDSPASVSFSLKIDINTDKDTSLLIIELRKLIKEEVEYFTFYKVEKVDININQISYEKTTS